MSASTATSAARTMRGALITRGTSSAIAPLHQIMQATAGGCIYGARSVSVLVAAPRWQFASTPVAMRLPAHAMMQQRWHYLDSADRTITVKSMDDPLEVLEFMSEHKDSDIRTHEAALRTLGRLATGKNYRKIVDDGRFHTILSTLASRFNDCDVRMLSMIADASARFQTSTSELTDLAQQLAEVVVRREDAFNPRNLSSVALALSIRGVRDVTLVQFLRTEILKLMDDLEPGHCVIFLEAFRRWGVFDRQLVDLIVERMLDEIDRFSGRDVVEALAVVSRLGLARGFLLRRLCTLAFENLHQFTPRELTKMAYSLAKLRFLANSNVDDLADALEPNMTRLVGSQLSEFLYTLGMVDARHQVDLVRTLVSQYTSGESAISSKTLGSLIDFSWTLCSMELVDEFKPEFKAALTNIFEHKPPQNRVPLTKLFDVICAIELEHQKLGIVVPPIWRAACDDADRFEMDRLESSRLHNEIVMRFDQLHGTANGMKWQLRMQRNRQCGPYRVDMADEDTKIILDVEIVNWPTSRRMKHRLLERLGYLPVRLEYWEWRRARTEHDQNVFLEREVCRAIESARQKNP